MAFTERIRLIFDVDGKGAERGFTGMVKSVREAEGVTGKLKAGFAGLKDNIGTFAMAGGAALVAFGAQAVQAFTVTAKAAVDLAAATGLSVEQASRWIAVGDDMGVTADQLQAGLGKIAKTLDTGKWGDYGIATRDASGEARDANAVLLDAFDMLGKITNATERARVGNELFGKGYANLAPIVGKTRAEYEQMLGAVEKGQVITEAERKKAERMRLAQDALADALKEVTLIVGESVAALAPYVERLADIVALVDKLPDGALDGLVVPTGVADSAGRASDSLAAMSAAALATKDPLQYLVDLGFSAAAAQTMLSDALYGPIEGMGKASTAADDLTGSLAADEEAAQEAADAFKSLTAEVDRQISSINVLESAQLDLADQTDAYNILAKETQDILNDATKTDAEKAAAIRDLRQAQIDLAGSIDDVARKTAEESGEVEGSVGWYAAQKDALEKMREQYPWLVGDIDKYIAALDRIPPAKHTMITTSGTSAGPTANMPGGNDTHAAGSLTVKAYASGTKSATPGLAWVGENGPELVGFNGGEAVLNAAASAKAAVGGGGGMTVNVYLPPGSSPEDTVRAIKEYEARNGKGWR